MARLRKIALWALGAIGAIGVVGFLVVPPIAKAIAQSQIAKALGREARIASIGVNPYALSATVRGFRLYEKDGTTPFVSFDELYVNVSSLSALRFAPVVTELRLVRPTVTIVREGDHAFNFSDIVETLAKRPKSDSKSYFSLHNVRVEGGRIEFDDQPLRAKHVVADLALGVPFVSSLPAQVDVFVKPSLQADVNGTRVAIEGETKPFAQALESTVAIAFRDLDLARYLPYLPVKPAFGLPSARLDADLRIGFGRSQAVPRLTLAGTLTLREVEVTDAGGATVAKLASLALPVEELDVFGRRATLGSVRAQALELEVVRLADDDINLARLAPPRAATGQTSAGEAAGNPARKPAPPPFEFTVTDAVLAQSRVSFTDQTVSPAFRTAVAPIDLAVRNLSSAEGAVAQTELALATALGERITHKGTLTLQPLAAEGAVDIAQVRPRNYAAYVVPAAKVEIDDGVLDVAARYRLARQGERLQFAVTGLDATLGNLRGRVVGEKPEAFRLGALAVKDASWDPAAGRLGVGELVLRDAAVANPFAREPAGRTPYARLAALTVRDLEGNPQKQVFRIGDAALRDLHATPPRAGAAPGGAPLRLGAMAVRAAEVDVAGRSARVGEVTLADGALRVARARGGRLSLADFAPPATSPPAPAPAAARAAGGSSLAPAASAKPAAAARWSWAVKRVAVDRFNLHWDDAVPAEPVSIAATSIAATVDNLSSARGTRSAFDARFTLNRTGTVAAAGQFAIDPPAADANLSVTALELLPLQPYFTENLNVLLTSGALTVKGKVRFDGATQPPRAGFAGEATIANFAALDKNTNEDLLRWRSLYFGGIDISVGPLSVGIGEIALSQYFARMIVTRDGRFNLQDIVVRRDAEGNVIRPGPPEKPAPEEEKRRAPAGPATSEAAQAGAAADAAAGTAARSPPGERPPITIGRISLAEGNINFSDFFVKPNYTVNLTDMTGSVSTLSSAPGTAADLELRGRLDGAAPVEVIGRLNPLAADAFLDIRGDIRGAELTTLTPYSQKFLGYGIERGRLSLNVAYKLEKRRLEAQNRVFLDQLTFGERVESPTATRLPVLLAVALLKNRNGEIDINLPISGTLDDPKFSLGGIILQVIVNLITRAVTAPFSLLAALLPGGGGEELSFAEFEPGRSAVTEAARKRLEALAKALADRPALRLDITGGVDVDADRRGLQRAWLDQQVRAVRARELARAGVDSDAADPQPLDPTAYETYLRVVYREAKIARPRNAVGLLRDLPVPEMETLLLTSHSVGDDDLRRLAVSRAQAVEEYLVKAGVSTERIFQVPPKSLALPAKDKASLSRVDLAIRH